MQVEGKRRQTNGGVYMQTRHVGVCVYKTLLTAAATALKYYYTAIAKAVGASNSPIFRVRIQSSSDTCTAECKQLFHQTVTVSNV